MIPNDASETTKGHGQCATSVRSRWHIVCLCIVAICTLAFAAGGRPSAADTTKGAYVELLHLWAAKEEKYALEAIAESLRAHGVDFQEQITHTNFTGIKSILTERLALGVPPTVVQWIGGREDVLALYDAGVFKLIRDEDLGQNGLEQMRPEIAEIVSYEDGYLLLPVGIHLLNHVVYNQMILDKIGVEVPQDWPEFIAAGHQAVEAGYYGIAISDERWQLRNLMLGLLVADLSVDEFSNLFIDYNEDGFDLGKIETAFERLRTLQELSNPDNADLSWASAVAHTASDRAMASVIGDFSSPLYPKNGHFTCALPPNNHYFLWAFDTFALTNVTDPGAIAGHQELLRRVSEPSVQSEYIVRKGGIPAFRGGDPSKLNPCSQRSLAYWESDMPRVFLTSTAWAQNMNVIANASRTFWRSPNMSAAEVTAMVNAKLKALSLNEGR